MTVHLKKLAVGVEDPDHLARIVKARVAASKKAKEGAVLRVYTRNTPKRRDELLDGGSLYWSIKGLIRVRARLLDLEDARDEDGQPMCAMVVEPKLVRVEPRAQKAFQGWRYLEPAEAPPDLRPDDPQAADLPGKMAAELKALGLL